MRKILKTKADLRSVSTASVPVNDETITQTPPNTLRVVRVRPRVTPKSSPNFQFGVIFSLRLILSAIEAILQADFLRIIFGNEPNRKFSRRRKKILSLRRRALREHIESRFQSRSLCHCFGTVAEVVA